MLWITTIHKCLHFVVLRCCEYPDYMASNGVEWLMNRKRIQPNRSTISTFHWSGWGKPAETWVRTAGVPVRAALKSGICNEPPPPPPLLLFLLLRTLITPQPVSISKGNKFFEVFFVMFYPSVYNWLLLLVVYPLATCCLRFHLMWHNLSLMRYNCNSSLMLPFLILSSWYNPFTALRNLISADSIHFVKI
jgi:hypothetical protein